MTRYVVEAARHPGIPKITVLGTALVKETVEVKLDAPGAQKKCRNRWWS